MRQNNQASPQLHTRCVLRWVPRLGRETFFQRHLFFVPRRPYSVIQSTYTTTRLKHTFSPSIIHNTKNLLSCNVSIFIVRLDLGRVLNFKVVLHAHALPNSLEAGSTGHRGEELCNLVLDLSSVALRADGRIGIRKVRSA